MAKSQRRSNRETKKPKKPKKSPAVAKVPVSAASLLGQGKSTGTSYKERFK
jgi:hypothetical protein